MGSADRDISHFSTLKYFDISFQILLKQLLAKQPHGIVLNSVSL